MNMAIEESDREELLLQEVLDSLPQGVVMFSAEGKLRFCNRRFRETYGFTESDLHAGAGLEDLVTLRARSRGIMPDITQYVSGIMEQMRNRNTMTGHHRLDDGRIIHYIYLPLRSGGWIVTHEDVTTHLETQRLLEHMASHDDLTGLPNRTAIKVELDQALRFNAREDQLAVMFVDLDNFKTINETLGHPTGDELLRTVAERLKGSIRANDRVARFGGDAFVIVLTSLESPRQAAFLARRIRDAVVKPFSVHGHRIVADCSIGIALAPGDGLDTDVLLRHADLALHDAKDSGGATFRFFEPSMNARVLERRNLELDLRAGFEDDQFELHYQPLLNLKQNRVTGCEALMRWRHPARGWVSPAEFIPVAESIGLIGRIGEWVIRTACAQAVLWPDNISVAVNVSPRQIRDSDLAFVVAEVLAETGLAPGRLELEITEAILLENTEENLVMLGRLRDLGVKIVMDDFGTGFSSLGYLQKFRFDKIKIDQSFVHNLSDDGDANSIVRAITGIADSFDMMTTAEGVETERQRDIVAALGCTEMQGHLFSHALAPAEISCFLNRQKTRSLH